MSRQLNGQDSAWSKVGSREQSKPGGRDIRHRSPVLQEIWFDHKANDEAQPAFKPLQGPALAPAMPQPRHGCIIRERAPSPISEAISVNGSNPFMRAHSGGMHVSRSEHKG
jgi:hypothetical protein